jgi:hypothetical protein
MGIKNATSTFSKIINVILNKWSRWIKKIFVNDINIHSLDFFFNLHFEDML